LHIISSRKLSGIDKQLDNSEISGSIFGLFHKKHIIFVLLSNHFDTQSEKAYHFCAQAALK